MWKERIGDQARFNGTHKRCGARFSIFATMVEAPPPAWRLLRAEDGREFTYSSGMALYVCACGSKREARRVLGKVNPSKRCTAKCEAATGHDCECACGGKNHGAAHG